MEFKMSIKKQFLKSRPVCKVTFRVDKEAANTAEKLYIVGDFNQWDKQVPIRLWTVWTKGYFEHKINNDCTSPPPRES